MPPEAPPDDADSPGPRRKRKKKDPSDAPSEPTAVEKPVKAKKRASGPRRPKAAPRVRKSWRRFFLEEALTVGLGVALGLGAASYLLWRRALDDVDAWRASPPRPTPGVVWSAPITVDPGDPATVPLLVEWLLAAGYERVSTVHTIDQFSVDGDTVHVWTSSTRDTPEGRGNIRIAEGKVADVADGLVLHAIPLAVLGDLEAHRTSVDLGQVSPWMEPALLAMEDVRFRDHVGVDPLGVVRAVLHNLLRGQDLQGGSTLTQQLAKNLFLSQERTARRKVREAFFAAALERRMSKDELLALYLTEVYLGNVGGVPIHGVEQGARAFFGVSASSLDIGQAATLAGIISSPNAYNPLRHPERATERRDLALDRMVATGALESDARDREKARELVVGGVIPAASRRAPWAVDNALDQLEEALGGGIVAGYGVYTTIDPMLQAAAERSVAAGLAEVVAEFPEASGAEAALVAVRVEDGAIVAWVGGRDYTNSPFDRAGHAWRQVGSTVKPLTLLSAFDDDSSLTPLSRVVDEPITRRIDGRTWTPRNYDGTWLGDISLRTALEGSRNIPAIKLAEEVGIPALQSDLRALGLSRATNLPSVALGAFPATPVEVAGAYTVFPGGGTAHTPYLVTRVDDPFGQPVLRFEPERRDVASARAAALATSVLEGVVQDGTGSRVSRYGVEGPVGGKTGTTDDYRDAWFVGFTPTLSVAVWVGADQGGGFGLSGSRGAIPLWAPFVAASNTLNGTFPRPTSVTTVTVCAESERVARPACPTVYSELVPADHVPDASCDVHGGPIVDLAQGLRRLFGRRKTRDEPDRRADD
jgi:penicillin-binding protein 1B